MSSFDLCSQAAHYGCGCWAENACNMNPYSTAVSTSGKPQLTLYNQLWSCECECVRVCASVLFYLSTLTFTTAVCFFKWYESETYIYIYLIWAFNFGSVSQTPKAVIIISDDLQTIPAEWLSSADWVIILHSVSQLHARCIAQLFGVARTFDMGHLLKICPMCCRYGSEDQWKCSRRMIRLKISSAVLKIRIIAFPI